MEQVLNNVARPARYAGGEWNCVVKGWDAVDIRFVLAYPDVYEIGMSNLGLAILYDVLNQRRDILAERVYAPWVDMEAELRRRGLRLFSLETRTPLREFDVIGFSLGYELTYSNLLNMLDLAGIPVLSADREDGCPLVIAGGTGALNPEPLADFIDAFVLGDGEEVVLEVADVVKGWKRDAASRKELLRRLAAVPGVYIPGFYRVSYEKDGAVREVEPIDGSAPPKLRKRFVEPLPSPPVRPVVPFLQTVHDRAAVEIQRGCTQGCRFCQAGIVYRPRLERGVDEVVRAAESIMASTGYNELSLLSLSTTDHSQIAPMIERLRRALPQRVALALPSLRCDSFSVSIAALAQSAGKRSITFAPEAGSQRLRDVINKPLTEDDILQAAEAAFAHGWTNVKLYFMVGLPTETLEDAEGIAGLAAKVQDVGRRRHGGRARVRVSTSNFIPKPHTPFQWAPAMGPDDLALRHDLLRRRLKGTGIALSWEEPAHSLLEAVLSRGDRRLGPVIFRAWKAGARFDAWNEISDRRLWEAAFAEAGVDPAFYAHRERDLHEVLPWSHIDTGVDEAFLRREWQKAQQGETTPDCHMVVCNVCGLEKRGSRSCEERLEALREQKGAGASPARR